MIYKSLKSIDKGDNPLIVTTLVNDLKSRANSYRADAIRFTDAIKTGTCPEEAIESWQQLSQVYRIVANELDGAARQLAGGNRLDDKTTVAAVEDTSSVNKSDDIDNTDVDYLDDL